MDQVLRLLCGCLTDSPEMKERRARRAVMEKGAPFRKKIHTFGFSFGQSEAVTLKSKVSEESGEYVLTWFTTTADKSKSGVIKFSDVARCESKDADALSLHAVLRLDWGRPIEAAKASASLPASIVWFVVSITNRAALAA